MTPTDAGAIMRLADELADIRVIPLKAVAVLHRLVFRYRPKGGRVACVDLAELAGDGIAKGTLIKMLDALERARLIVKEKWGVIRNGRWRQMPNKYHVQTAAEARLAQIAAADDEPEIVLGVVSLPVSESKTCTVLRVLEKDKPALVASDRPHDRNNGEALQLPHQNTVLNERVFVTHCIPANASPCGSFAFEPPLPIYAIALQRKP